MKYIYLSAMLLAAFSAALPAAAQEMKPEVTHNSMNHTMPGDTVPKVNGEIRKVDADAGKITIRHGEIPNLEMPAMTMVFRVASPDMLDKVKAGDQVLFTAEKNSGALTVTSIELVPMK